ncbi:MAG: zinc ribbon domain-containing protein [Clostridiaceae bacterium]|nr:zinc ribbon domain-containing protein [Clostridiaceae bacterium]
MAVKFNSVKCPECGASLPIEEGREKMFCSYCGSQIIMTRENEHIYRRIDEAGIKQAETDRMVRMRELDISEAQQSQKSTASEILTGLWIILSLIILTICVIKIAFLDDFTVGFMMLFYVGGPIIGGGAYLLFKLMPEKENERAILRNGGIRFPKSLEPFSEQNFQMAENILKNAGFTNVSCVNMHDLTLGLLRKPGKIETITVNDVKIMSAGKVYPANAAIVITYHGK